MGDQLLQLVGSVLLDPGDVLDGGFGGEGDLWVGCFDLHGKWRVGCY